MTTDPLEPTPPPPVPANPSGIVYPDGWVPRRDHTGLVAVPIIGEPHLTRQSNEFSCQGTERCASCGGLRCYLCQYTGLKAATLEEYR